MAGAGLTAGYIPLSEIIYGVSSKALCDTKNWIIEFIGKPHEGAKKLGPVCPKVPFALKCDSIYLKEISEAPLKVETLHASASSMMDCFEKLPPVGGPQRLLKTLMLVLSDETLMNAVQVLELVQTSLKSQLIDHGLLLGKFHPLLVRGSIYNANFNPHRAPFPLLALRPLIETDLGFLLSSPAEPTMRIRYLHSFISILGNECSRQTLKRATDALAELQKG